MGRSLGYFDEDESFDRPDLNYCPECKCFFASDNCTICGKPCPEEMRAGNRASVKQKKHRRSSGVRYVIPWYHSWWFIVIMMFVFPLAALVLAASSDNVRWLRILLIVLSALAIVGPFIVNIFWSAIFMWLSGGGAA